MYTKMRIDKNSCLPHASHPKNYNKFLSHAEYKKVSKTDENL